MNGAVKGAILLISLILAACAPTYKGVLDDFALAPVTCRDLTALTPLALAKGQSLKIELGPDSAVCDTPGGKSYAVLLEIPQLPPPAKITVKSFLLGEVPEKSFIFMPKVDFFDDDLRVARTSSEEEFRFTRAGFKETAEVSATALMYKAEGRFIFDEGADTPRFMAVYTTGELMKKHAVMQKATAIPVILPGIVGAIPTGTKEVMIPYAPAGLLSVTADRASKNDLFDPTKGLPSPE